MVNGDVTHLSIYANKLKQKGGDVLHGDIKEVSLVLAGANIGAFIDVPYIEHAEDGDPFEAVIYSGEEIELFHSEEMAEEAPEEEELEHAEPEEKEEKEDMADERTIKDVIDSMNDEQKEVLYYMVGEALEDDGEDENDVEVEDGDNESVEHSEEGENEEMAYNVFDEESRRANVLSHDDMVNIVELAKTNQVGSFQTALNIFAEENGLKFEKFLDADAAIVSEKNTPVLQGTNGVLTVGFIIVLLVCFTGFLIFWILSIRSRTLQFGIFRAMGMSMGSILVMLANEQLWISGVSIAMGTIIGQIASELFVPLIQLGYSAQGAIPLKVAAESSDYVRLFAIIGIMLIVCIIVLCTTISRIRIAQALKLGED